MGGIESCSAFRNNYMHQVGVVGIYDATGRRGMALVVEAERRGIPLLITGDDEDNLLEMASKTKSIEYAATDIQDREGLRQFCEQCVCVINCADSRSNGNQFSLLEACIEMNTHYIDALGHAHTVGELFGDHDTAQAWQERIRDAGIMCLIGAGYRNVVSEAVVQYMAARLSNVTRVVVCYRTKHAKLPCQEHNRDQEKCNTRQKKLFNFGPTGFDFAHGVRCPHLESEAELLSHSTGVENISLYLANKSAATNRVASGASSDATQQPLDTDTQSCGSLLVCTSDDAGHQATTVLRIPDIEGFSTRILIALAEKCRAEEDVHVGLATAVQAYGGQFVLGLQMQPEAGIIDLHECSACDSRMKDGTQSFCRTCAAEIGCSQVSQFHSRQRRVAFSPEAQVVEIDPSSGSMRDGSCRVFVQQREVQYLFRRLKASPENMSGKDGCCRVSSQIESPVSPVPCRQMDSLYLTPCTAEGGAQIGLLRPRGPAYGTRGFDPRGCGTSAC